MVEQYFLEVDILKLREATNLLLDCLESKYGQSIRLSQDDYWEIPSNERHDILSGPDRVEITLGKLSDDWQELCKLLSRDGVEPLLWHDLASLASVIRAISDKELP